MAERARRLLASHALGPVLVTALVAACLPELLTRPQAGDAARNAVWVVLLCAPLLAVRSHPAEATVAEAAILLVAPGVHELPQAGILIQLALSYACGARAPGRLGFAAVASLLVSLQVTMGFSEFPNFELALPTLVPWWLGREVRRRGELVRELAWRTRDLEAAQDAFARLAVRRERARIAHELHDIVAHHLAVVVVQAGAGRMAAPGRADLEAERFATIGLAGRQALADMARLVDVLHADHGAAQDRMRMLLEEADAGGLDVALEGLPSGLELPTDVEEAAYRVVREALTNAIKHAPGARVRVRLALRDSELDIVVQDSGAQASPALAGTGSGLGVAGMRHRVESLGGSLEAGRGPDGGWRVRARVPVREPAVVPLG